MCCNAIEERIEMQGMYVGAAAQPKKQAPEMPLQIVAGLHANHHRQRQQHDDKRSQNSIEKPPSSEFKAPSQQRACQAQGGPIEWSIEQRQ
jgi:hypothetical protein